MFKSKNLSILQGLIFVAIFALGSMYLALIPWFVSIGISSLIIAILLGILFGNTFRHNLPTSFSPGIQFSAKRILRLAIIFYGFRLTIQEIISLGIEVVILDILVVSLTLILGTYVGVKFFKLDRHLAILTAGGASICGAAAVLAMEDILKSEPFKTSAAVGTVVLFGTISMFIYPALFHLGLFGFTDVEFGIFAGASIHEVAQALVAGNNVSLVASNTAVIVKMTRVLLLVPVLFLLSYFENKRIKNQANQQKQKITIPWFAIGFVLMIGINSLQILPAKLVGVINYFDIFLLTMAMAAIGMETDLKKIKSLGPKLFYFSASLFLWLGASVWFLVSMI
jgi:uncharacterized integral membrane protein (TIGR00698 family)